MTQHRCQQHANYDNYAEKGDLRRSLLAEQGHICCYCMQRIAIGRMKIEHWHCQNNHAAEQLAYGNLLGACQGNEGRPPKQQHCDTRKGDRDITFNPANPEHDVECYIRYLGDGTVEASHTQFDAELQSVLNLNAGYLLRQNRKAVFDRVLADLGRRSGTRTKAEIQRMIATWSSPDAEGRLPEYCRVAIYLLMKRL